ncbi:copper chaperone PCu(A)C [Govanella unica]|uniref:Copper chaperone PCu(A)C n=1 Tax=Govanella unica TaxID=2975056 RepID=A0A9X3Z7Y2_9PROT|nr:copper chaperone PCu(A)C [Govania unica]MDA5194657.1 copper chaperone PCu(A)C [Govania unica]
MNRLLRTLSILVLTLVAAPAFAAGSLTVSDAWIRPPAVAGRPAALYFTVTNSGKTADELQSIATPAAKTAQLHQTLHENGVMSMKKVETVEIPADSVTNFAPMGLHVMLFTPDASLVPGAKIPVTLTFKTTGPLSIEAEVKAGKPAADSHKH